MITAVTVSVEYVDYLKETLPYLMKYVDRVVVITHPYDIYTIRTATHYGADYYSTNAFYEAGAVFNKGLAINKCIKDLQIKDWIMHVDADIVLLDKIDTTKLDINNLYGTIRLRTIESKWRRIKSGEAPTLLSMPCIYKYGQYTPSGFFQLWNTHVEHEYPTDYEDAYNSDFAFSLKWPAINRKLLPDYPVLHLETSDNERGINWRGRKTKYFRG